MFAATNVVAAVQQATKMDKVLMTLNLTIKNLGNLLPLESLLSPSSWPFGSLHICKILTQIPFAVL